MGECPELDDAGKTTISYFVGGAAVTDDDSGFGLDAYEPLFFNSQDWWAEQNAANPWKVTLTIAADPEYATIYYFCHIHAGMSAIIDITGSTASPAAGSLNPAVLSPALTGAEDQASAVAIYDAIVATDQKAINDYDEACGTHNTYAATTRSECESTHFLCGAGATGNYAACLEKVDCQMHHEMAISVPSGSGISKFATFARQMIPHHQNAVAMAKTLAKFHGASDYPTDEKTFGDTLIRSIINVQNKQIQEMQGWLDGNAALAGTSYNCYAGDTSDNDDDDHDDDDHDDHDHDDDDDNDEPCFPASAMVTRDDGSPARVDELKAGDRIMATDASGAIAFDTVSLLSIAQPQVEATYVSLTTRDATLTLTMEHHLPVGPSCCKNLMKAKDIAIGQAVWTAKSAATVVSKCAAGLTCESLTASLSLPSADALCFSPLLSFPSHHGCRYVVVDELIWCAGQSRSPRLVRSRQSLLAVASQSLMASSQLSTHSLASPSHTTASQSWKRPASRVSSAASTSRRASTLMDSRRPKRKLSGSRRPRRSWRLTLPSKIREDCRRRNHSTLCANEIHSRSVAMSII